MNEAHVGKVMSKKGMKKKRESMVPNCVPAGGMKKGGLKKWFQEKWVDIGAPKKDGKYQLVEGNQQVDQKENIQNAYHLQKPQRCQVRKRRVLSAEKEAQVIQGQNLQMLRPTHQRVHLLNYILWWYDRLIMEEATEYKKYLEALRKATESVKEDKEK